MSDEEFLYGVPGAEVLYLTAETVWELEIEPWHDAGDIENSPPSWVIEKWTATPLAHFVPSTDCVLESIESVTSDEVSEGAGDHLDRAFGDPAVIEAFDAALALLKANLTDGWFQAEDKVGELVVTLDADGKPLLDGQPMYVERADS